MTDIELLPLPEPKVQHDALGGLYLPLEVSDYAHANMEPLIEQLSNTAQALAAQTEQVKHYKAENERLRGELERAQYAAGRWENVAKSQASWELLWSEEKARAERLAEALWVVVELDEEDGDSLHNARAIARAALDQEDRKGDD